MAHPFRARHGRAKRRSPRAPVQRMAASGAIQPHRQRYGSSPTTPSSARRCAISSASRSQPARPRRRAVVDEIPSFRCPVSNRVKMALNGAQPRPGAHRYAEGGRATITSVTAPPGSPLLDIATGQVITQCKKRHRHQEFLAFRYATSSQRPRTVRRSPHRDNLPTSTGRSELGSGDRDTHPLHGPPMQLRRLAAGQR